MKQFFKHVFSTLVGNIITLIIAGLFILGFIGIMVASIDSTTTYIPPEKSVLHIYLNQTIPDHANEDPFSGLLTGGSDANAALGLDKILTCIRRAKSDERIKGIFLELSEVPSGLATINELRQAFLDFRKSGKFVYAYSNNYSQRAYYLATVADSIYLNPMGGISLTGINASVMFMKGLLDKIGIKAEVIRHGKYKSAIEPFTLTKLSDENRQQITEYITPVWSTMISEIAKSRKLNQAEVQKAVDSLLLFDGMYALQKGYVHKLLYRDEVTERIKSRTGATMQSYVTLNNYILSPLSDEEDRASESDNIIALIFAEGEIRMGNSDEGIIGAETLSKAIESAADDSKVKAIVLRVNSPGGDALASELIWRALEKAKKSKPVIASMGNVAASGGYYIACGADTILASEHTLTGSIGVFGLMFNMQELLNQKLGITFDNVNTGKYADIGKANRPLSEYERSVIQKRIEHIYDTFLDRVSSGRGMKVGNVDSIAQGRVWIGARAKEIRLIDAFGGMNDAVVLAAKLSKLSEYRVKVMPKKESIFERFFTLLNRDVSIRELAAVSGVSEVMLRHVMMLTSGGTIQARLPLDIMLE
ncbi:protease IV [uncultured bacterium]|nr:protease IV [uncultured bacterium]